MRPTAVILVGGLCLGSGYLIGVWRRDESAPRHVAVEAADTRARPTAPAVVAPASAAPADDAAFTRARALVDGALARGVWSDADRAQLEQLEPMLTRAHAAELARRIAAARDDGHLRATVAAAPR